MIDRINLPRLAMAAVAEWRVVLVVSCPLTIYEGFIYGVTPEFKDSKLLYGPIGLSSIVTTK